MRLLLGRTIRALPCVAILAANTCMAATIQSPNGHVALSFDLKEVASKRNCPMYSVSYRGRPIIAESRLGFELTDGTSLNDGFAVQSADTISRNTTWKPVYGERSTVRDHYRQLTVELSRKDAHVLDLVFRCYDSGVAFCYRLPKTASQDRIRIKSENTEFRFHADHTAWSATSAQGQYAETTLSKLGSGVERPLTLRVDDNTYAAIAEARLVDYARMKLNRSSQSPFSVISSLGSAVEAALPLTTPWRVIMLGDTPGQLLESNDIILNLNAPNAIADTSWIRPGKVIREVSLTTQGGKACVDFAEKHNLQFVEFDAGWYGPENRNESDATTITLDPKRSSGPLDLHEVIRYADERNIGIILYVNRRALERQLDDLLPLYERWGIKGIKYGFVNVGSQQWTSWLHDAIRKTAKHKIMIDIHDQYRPTGYSRTYPNLMTQEGIGGDEVAPSNEQTLTIIFTRMLAGAGDNTICYYDTRVERNASHAYQLAKAVCVYSPWQFLYWYDRPQASPRKTGGAGDQKNIIGDEPELEFYDHVPTVWDDTKVIHGSIGEYAVIARRSGENWFIGCMNSGADRTLKAPLNFLQPKQKYVAHVYSDDPTVDTRTHVKIERFLVDANTVLNASMTAKGGQAIRLVPAQSTDSYRPLPQDLLGQSPVDWVDPLIDTHQSRWFYFNSASRPFGMVNLSPDTQTKGSWKSGYLYGDTAIRCFSHIHAWQLSGIAVMPITGEMTGHRGMDTYQSEFSHDDEVVQAGYHKVVLKKYGITAELTSTVRTGFHRYAYPTTKDAYILFDVGAMLGHGPMVSGEVTRISDTEVTGMSLMKSTNRRKKDTPVFFVAQFSQPMTGFGGWQKGELKEVSDTISGADAGAFARFKTEAGTPVLMRLGMSYTSIAGARRNLKAELPHWDFDRVVQESRDDWNTHLSRIKVTGGSDAQQTKLYTDLWRSLLGRRIVSDVDGSYCDMTGDKRAVRKVPLGKDGKPVFAMHNFDACWGSHWSLDILWPLLCPERYSDFCNTMVQMYKDGGLIPRGPSGGNYTFVMIGDSAAPFVTSAYAKGIRDFDCELALEGLVKNTEPEGGRYYGGYAKEPRVPVHEQYSAKGYVPWDTHLAGGHGKAITSLTLYNAYHDWCIAQMAKGLGRDDIYKRFIAGGKNYRHVIWKEKQSAWVRMIDGSWMPDYLPRAKTFEQKGFCETSAAVTTFYVPHDAMGLADLLGGPDAAAKKLNEQFEASVHHGFHLPGREHGNAWVDYANQDGTGAAHYFNRIGFPWLSQKWVRAVQSAAFGGTDPYSGYNGDEDQGQMGALSALMAIGLFQFDGGSGLEPRYDITAPVFDKVTIQLSCEYYSGKTVTITTRNQAEGNVYIQSAKWNGKPLNTCWLAHKDLVQGGVLELTLGPKPNKQWGIGEN